MKEKKIGNTVVRLLQGDITACEVDAIVNTSGRKLLTVEETEIVSSVPPVPAPNGPDNLAPLDIQITPGEALKARYILNTVSIETTTTTGASKIRKIIKSILAEAQEQHLETLAIPAIGTGLGRFPLDKCADILLHELSKSVHQQGNTIRKVIFVLDNQKSYKAFEQVLSNFSI